jgi:ribonuclease J
VTVKLRALGGLGEFGANSLLLEDGGGRLLVDAGAAFSDLAAFGVAYEVPDFGTLRDGGLHALVLTHAHDDHIKGVSFVREAFPEVDVLASRTTLAWARRALADDEPMAARELRAGEAAEAGPARVEALPVSHSIPGSVALRLTTAAGRLVLATDLRLAPSALEEETSEATLARWGDEGADGLLLDATNALVNDEPVSEAAVGSALADEIGRARATVVAVSFASHLGRFRQLALAAHAAGRVIVPVGRGLVESLDVQGQLGGLRLPPGLVRPARELARLPRHQVVVAATGAQGESGSAFSRLAVDLLPGLRLRRDDVVLHAARVIPGNERRLAQLFDHCVRRGARVVTAAEAPIHVSGHPHVGELVRMLELLRPRWVLPVHGRRRHLEEVAKLARRHGSATVVAENGEELEWSDGSLAPSGELRPCGRVLLEDVGEEVLDSGMLRHRRALAREGLVIAVLPCGAEGPVGAPQLHISGLPLQDGVRDRLIAGLAVELARLGALARRDPDALRSTMTRWLRSELRRRSRRRPVIVALVVEL